MFGNQTKIASSNLSTIDSITRLMIELCRVSLATQYDEELFQLLNDKFKSYNLISLFGGY